ncbi:MAG: alpha-L-fucosidase [Gemmatimonadaceae bacterium]|nr:alpha-L-fucosidase [Gemmatimonadaceae bacterium]
MWRPGETDVSIRPGWFWHPAEDEKVRSAENLEQLWFTSVGRNSKLLLNVPPTTSGRFHDTDVANLRRMRERLDTRFADQVTHSARRRFEVLSDTSATLTLSLPRPVAIGAVDLREDIAQGQRVAAFVLEGQTVGGWQTLVAGTTIGYRRAEPLPPVTVSALRLRITDAVERPREVSVAAFGPS